MTGKVIVQANQAHPEWFKFKFKTRRDNEMFPNCITLMRWDGSVLADHLNEDQKPKDFNKWVNFNSANWPDKLSPGAFQTFDFAKVDCMIIAFVSMTGFTKKAETAASLELFDAFEEISQTTLEAVGDPMFFWTEDETEIAFHKEKMGITWDDIPSMGAVCKGKYYAYPRENSTNNKGAIQGWLRILYANANKVGSMDDLETMKKIMQEASVDEEGVEPQASE